MIRKRFHIICPAVLALAVILMTGCGAGRKKQATIADATPTEMNAMLPTQEAQQDTPTPTFTVTPTPTPRPPFGVTTMSLYKNMKDEKLRRKYAAEYASVWKKGSDITSFECIASDAAEIPNNGRYFQDIWRDEWNRFDNHDSCKICYRVQFQTTDGLVVDKMLMTPGDELEYRDYIENYLYDDIHQEKGKWYYHLLPENQNENTILSSLKFTAGQKIEMVYSPITVSAYVYYSDLDFDAAGNYIGDISYTVQMVNTDAGAKMLPKNNDSTDVEASVYPTPEQNTSDAVTTPATAVSIDIKNSNGKGKTYLVDKDYNTRVNYAAKDSVTVTSEAEMAGIYIIWGSPVVPYTVTAGGKEIACGENGFLHDYIAFDTPVNECVITIAGETSICDIYAYSEGVLPDSVQVWEPPYEKADIVIFSTHADDEVLFFGGVATLYGGVQKKRVQIVYLCHYWNGDRIREHEKLDGLWTMGLRAYPVNMPFNDYYAKTLADAKKVYSYEDVLTSVTENIRRFQPLIIVTHDEAGEYGHGGHMLLHQTVKEAINHSMEAEFRPDSAQKYGTWDVPKTYIHLYKENPIRLDLRQPAPELGGETPIAVEAAAYKKHVSQQWCWFYVSDDYEYSCADFGLFRTTVGNNETNDMFENLVSYGEQEENARRAEEERLAELTRAAELTQAAELTRTAEAERNSAKDKDKKNSDAPKTEEAKNTSGKNGGKLRKVLLAIAAVVVGVFLIFAAYIFIANRIYERKRAKRREALRRRLQESTEKKDPGQEPFEDDYL